MAEIIYHVATTVDNFIAGPNGEADDSIFLYEGDHIPAFLEEINQYEIVLMGSKTYEYGFQFGLKPGEPSYKGLKHYVFSKTLKFESNNDVELVEDATIEFVAKLKQTTPGKIWLCGGGKLAGALLEAELIDKLKLKINPVLIAKGISLFGGSQKKVNLELIDVHHYKSGVVLPTYTVKY